MTKIEKNQNLHHGSKRIMSLSLPPKSGSHSHLMSLISSRDSRPPLPPKSRIDVGVDLITFININICTIIISDEHLESINIYKLSINRDNLENTSLVSDDVTQVETNFKKEN
ncbi:hypothetical protein Anas_07622 [Armadillidium nasatum]|uniref:Uncharacterized protein n=1 Tax=Armadillidium nasatum TaxID=96803 RepID=A0A5N5TJJ9_9CRUS|nr:hypothetical protein Anas_07622 [Armadillidium nasatum]